MENNNRKVILYIAASLDGYIAKPDDDLSFLSLVEQAGEDYGYNRFIETVDTLVLGRKTYDWVVKQAGQFPTHGKTVYVVTQTARPPLGNIQFYTGSPQTLIAALKSQPGQNIFIDGGAQLVNSLLQHRLIEEFIISVIPVLLGGGISLFTAGQPEQRLQLLACRQYNIGLVQLHYRLAGNN